MWYAGEPSLLNYYVYLDTRIDMENMTKVNHMTHFPFVPHCFLRPITTSGFGFAATQPLPISGTAALVSSNLFALFMLAPNSSITCKNISDQILTYRFGGSCLLKHHFKSMLFKARRQSPNPFHTFFRYARA